MKKIIALLLLLSSPAGADTFSDPPFVLGNSGVGAGSYVYSNITVNAQGLVTAASSNTVGPYATAALGQLPGTATNNNATAGNIGEVISAQLASGSAITLTTATGANIISISLTAGDWDVYANGVVSTPTLGATLFTDTNLTINTVSATPAGNNDFSYSAWVGGLAGNGVSRIIGLQSTKRLSLAGTTTVYAVIYATVTGAGVTTSWGGIWARRRR